MESSSTKGNIRHGKLKSQKELKKITDSEEYKKSDYEGKNKKLNVATASKGLASRTHGSDKPNKEIGKQSFKKKFSFSGKQMSDHYKARKSRTQSQSKMNPVPYLTGGQAKIAAKAPPPNKIDEKDFAVLRAEKAKGRGMGLQDEKVQPGKVQKAVFGKMIKGVSKGVKKILGGSRKTSTANPGNVMVSGSGRGMGSMLPKLLQKAIDDGVVKPASKGRMMKARVGKSIKTGKISDMSFDEKMKRVESGQINKKTGKFTSMNAMRDAKGFQKGETASDFNKRRMKLERAAKVAKSTRLGKILLPVVGAAVAAKTYLNSKMNNKKDVKKKMGGGMMQKPIGYKSGMGPAGAGAAGPSAGRPGRRRQGPKGGIGSLPKKRSDDLVVIFSTKDGTKKIKRSDLDNMSAPKQKMGGGMMKKYSKGGGADSGRIGEMKSRLGVAMNKAKRLRSMDRLTDRDIEKAKSLVKGKMGGGMMQKPMGYSKGTMVKARGCKLGRTRPTKIT